MSLSEIIQTAVVSADKPVFLALELDKIIRERNITPEKFVQASHSAAKYLDSSGREKEFYSCVLIYRL